MTEEPPPALLRSGEVGVHVAELALRTNVVSALLGKVQHDFPLQQSDVDVARQAVDVHVPNVMSGYNPCGAGRLDAAFQIEAGKGPMPGKFRGDDQLDRKSVV